MKNITATLRDHTKSSSMKMGYPMYSRDYLFEKNALMKRMVVIRRPDEETSLESAQNFWAFLAIVNPLAYFPSSFRLMKRKSSYIVYQTALSNKLDNICTWCTQN